MIYRQIKTHTVALAVLTLSACGLSLVDKNTLNPTSSPLSTVTTNALKPSDHPFAPMFLTPDLSVQLLQDDKEQWTYELTYSGTATSQRLNVSWDKNDTFSFHGTDKIVIFLSCGNTEEHELAISPSHNNIKNDLHFRLLCPRNIDLSDAKQKEKFEQELKQGQRPMLIGRLIIPPEMRFDWIISKSQAIWIYSLESLALRKEQAGVIEISLNPETTEKLKQSARNYHLNQQWQRLQTEYPHFHDILSELKTLYPHSFLVPQNSSYIGHLYQDLPTLHLYIHHMQGFLNLRSRATSGDKGLDGQDISPEFYKSKIQLAAPKGQDGSPGDFRIENRTALEPCLPRASSIHGGTNSPGQKCPVTYTVCAGSTPGTPGLSGKDGHIAGLPGLDGFPSLPGPIVLLDVGNTLMKNKNTHDGHILFDLLPAPPAPGGVGTSGQLGGEGGKGGSASCTQESRNKAVVYRFPDGPKGKDAPSGKNGELGPSLSCFPASIFSSNTPLELGPFAHSCRLDSNQDPTEKVQLSSKPHYTQLNQPKVTYPFWVLPLESNDKEHSRSEKSNDTDLNQASNRISYASWRQMYWLPKEFRNEVTKLSFKVPTQPQVELHDEPVKDFMIPRQRPVW